MMLTIDNVLAMHGVTGNVVPISGSQTYSSPGSYNFVVPAGVTRLTVAVWGAGGSGGGGDGTSGGYPGQGGCGGGFALAFIPVTQGQTLNVTVGSGGTAVGAALNGNKGGSSTVTYNGNTITAYGGDGGQAGSTSGYLNNGSGQGGTVSTTSEVIIAYTGEYGTCNSFAGVYGGGTFPPNPNYASDTIGNSPGGNYISGFEGAAKTSTSAGNSPGGGGMSGGGTSGSYAGANGQVIIQW